MIADMLKPKKRGKGFSKPTLTESQARGVKELRMTLGTLLKVAQDDRIRALLSENERLNTEIDRFKKAKQGNVQRLDDARTPSPPEGREPSN